MKQKNNSIKSYTTSRLLRSRICLGLTLLFSLVTMAQTELEETLESNARRVVIDLGIIDHLQLVNSDSDALRVHAENSQGAPRTELKDNGQTLYIGSTFTRLIEEEPLMEDKLCSIEPLYPSFQIAIPSGKEVQVSIGKGNLYAEDYEGDLELRLEEGLVRLDQVEGSVKMYVHRGQIRVSGLEQMKVLAQTSMGKLVLKRQDGKEEDHGNRLEAEFGQPTKELEVTTVMGSIYLEE